MLSVKGIYKDGNVLLDEDLSIDTNVEVIVTFLDNKKSNKNNSHISIDDFSFREAQNVLKDYKGSISEAVIEPT